MPSEAPDVKKLEDIATSNQLSLGLGLGLMGICIYLGAELIAQTPHPFVIAVVAGALLLVAISTVAGTAARVRQHRSPLWTETPNPAGIRRNLVNNLLYLMMMALVTTAAAL